MGYAILSLLAAFPPNQTAPPAKLHDERSAENEYLVDLELRDVPIGIAAGGARRENIQRVRPSFAPIVIGAQRRRAAVHFAIGDDHMPKQVYHAYGYVKKAAAIMNAAADRLPGWEADAIARAAEEVIAGKLDDHFPLYVWQTGSGTAEVRRDGSNCDR